MGKTLTFISIAICAVTLASCSEGTDPEGVDAIPIIVDRALFNAYRDLPQAEFSIDAGVINGDILKLTVSYSDGCQDYEFKLIASTYLILSHPPKALLGLFREEAQNSCTKETSIPLYFDLTPLQELTHPGTILIPLGDTVPVLRYHF